MGKFFTFCLIVMVLSTLVGVGFGNPAMGALIGVGIILVVTVVNFLVMFLFFKFLMDLFNKR